MQGKVLVWLHELIEARNRRPTEQQAARKIASFAVVPAASVGLLAGTQLVGLAAPMERLLWICTAMACGAGFGSAFLVLGIYYFFGFRPVAVIADSLVGGFAGFFCGGTLTMLLMLGRVVNPNQALWALLLVPLGALLVPLVRAWNK